MRVEKIHFRRRHLVRVEVTPLREEAIKAVHHQCGYDEENDSAGYFSADQSIPCALPMPGVRYTS